MQASIQSFKKFVAYIQIITQKKRGEKEKKKLFFCFDDLWRVLRGPLFKKKLVIANGHRV